MARSVFSYDGPARADRFHDQVPDVLVPIVDHGRAPEHAESPAPLLAVAVHRHREGVGGRHRTAAAGEIADARFCLEAEEGE